MDAIFNANLQLNQLLTLTNALPLLIGNQNFALNQNQAQLSIESKEKPDTSNNSGSEAYNSENRSKTNKMSRSRSKEELDDDEDFGYLRSDRAKRCGSFNRILVSYPWDATEYEVNAAFKKFGKIQNIQIIRDRLTKIEKGK